jgi:predicted nucleic acid-binding protein
MPETVVIADASCLISLSNINRLELLKDVFSNIIITPEVGREFGEQSPDWIVVEAVTDRQKQILLELEVDEGEASAIALALEKKDPLLIIDEKKGRKVALSLGIHILGTLGILMKAKEKGIIPFIKPEIEKLKQTGFRFSDELIAKILIAVNE